MQNPIHNGVSKKKLNKETLADELIIANRELVFQNQEKEKRAAELLIANKELVFQNEEKEKRTADLLSANKELESFNYISSHDLQEPLRKIQIFGARLIEKESQGLSDNAKDYLQRMMHAANRMQTLIVDLLAYSRTNTGKRKYENTDLNKIVDEVKEELKDELRNKHATIEAKELCHANIIAFQFRQVLYNLIGNSLKFSNPQTPPHILITSRIATGKEIGHHQLSPEKKYCHITIADNGIGFDLQYKERIFEVFQRLHPKEQYEGTGIGLAIVKKIIDNHHGYISATSEFNKGATFDLYIPSPDDIDCP